MRSKFGLVVGVAVAAAAPAAWAQQGGAAGSAGGAAAAGRQAEAQQQPGQPAQPGQPGAAAARADAGGGGEIEVAARQIARFIDPDTVAVGHVDLSRVDAERAQAFLDDVIGSSQLDPQQKQQARQDVQSRLGLAQNWLRDVKQAGAEHLFVVASSRQGQLQPAVIVPTGEGDDVQKLQQLLQPKPDANQMQMPVQMTAKAIGDAVVLAPQQDIARFEQAAAGAGAGAGAGGDAARAEADEILRGLSTTEKAGLHFAVKATPQLSSAIDQMAGGGRQEVGGPQVNIARDVRWMSIGFDFPQQGPAVKAVVQAQDEQSARQLADWFGQKLSAARQQQQAQPGEPQLAGGAESLKPEVRGDQLVITLSNQQAKQFLQAGLRPAQQMQQQQMPGNTGGQAPGASGAAGTPKPSGAGTGAGSGPGTGTNSGGAGAGTGAGSGTGTGAGTGGAGTR